MLEWLLLPTALDPAGAWSELGGGRVCNIYICRGWIVSACLSVSLRSSGIAFFIWNPSFPKVLEQCLFIFFPCDSQTRALLCYVQSSGLSASLKCSRVDQGERRRLGVTQELPVVHFCPDMGWLEARRRPPMEAMTHVWQEFGSEVQSTDITWSPPFLSMLAQISASALASRATCKWDFS